MGNWVYYVVGVFVIAMIYILALGGAAMVGGKFNHLKDRLVNRTKTTFRWRRKKFQRY